MIAVENTFERLLASGIEDPVGQIQIAFETNIRVDVEGVGIGRELVEILQGFDALLLEELFQCFPVKCPIKPP